MGSQEYAVLWAKVLKTLKAYVNAPRHLKLAALQRYYNACKAASAVRKGKLE